MTPSGSACSTHNPSISNIVLCWSFTLLNNCRDTLFYAKASSPSILFLTAFTGDGDDGRFLTRDEASTVAGWDDLKQKRTFWFAFFFKTDFQSFSNLTGITINNDIEVDHRTDPDQEDGGANTATIVLAVLLALVILAGVAVLLFVQRGWVEPTGLPLLDWNVVKIVVVVWNAVFL